MNVITLASRKGGAGKSTLTAHLAGCAQGAGHRCLIIDADPQGSLTLWHSLRTHDRLVLQSAAARGIHRAVTSVRSARRPSSSSRRGVVSSTLIWCLRRLRRDEALEQISVAR